ncbi:MAG: PCRF domain-containing protein, partial [Anaerolineales bacterium]
MFDKLAGLEARYEELHNLMVQHAGDYARVGELARERSELEPVVLKYREYKKAQSALDQAKAMLSDSDPEIKALAENEAAALSPHLEALEKELKSLLLPRDSRDQRNVIVEIRAGTGGDEAGLFAADLFRMYSR